MIPLHLHSYYSLLTGTIKPDTIIQSAKNYGLDSIALTDTNGMYGLIPFFKKALDEKIKPLLGSCITDPENEKNYAVLLAKNSEGYSELCRIITKRKLNDDFSLTKVLIEHTINIYTLTPSIELLEEIKNHNNLFAELISTEKQKKKTRELYNYASDRGVKYIVSNPVYFLNEEDFEIHKLLRAIDLNKAIDNLSDDEMTDKEYFFKNPADIDNLYKMLPEAISNTELIASQCNVNLKIGESKYPNYPLAENGSAKDYLTKLAYDGLHKKYTKITDDILKRVDEELSVIDKLRFNDYFLIVWEIMQEAKRRGMMTIGRGSAANSIVAYLLDLTQVDPVKHNLFFERFLNKARKSPPDVDIDFSWKERDEIVRFVFERYGYEKVAMISTHVTFKARSAFRETAKAFGFSDREISKYSKYIPWTDAGNLPNVTQIFPEARNLNFNVEPWSTIIKYATRLANFPRHLSIHPGGIVITPSNVTDYCALEYAKNKGLGLIITQPDMYAIEDLGLIKIDLLSQRSLGVLRDTVNMVNKNYSDE
jgi:DNA polymerase III alpha subunit